MISAITFFDAKMIKWPRQCGDFAQGDIGEK